MNAYTSGYHTACGEYLIGDLWDVPMAIRSFKDDPADSKFQEGYLAALIVINANIAIAHYTNKEIKI